MSNIPSQRITHNPTWHSASHRYCDILLPAPLIDALLCEMEAHTTIVIRLTQPTSWWQKISKLNSTPSYATYYAPRIIHCGGLKFE